MKKKELIKDNLSFICLFISSRLGSSSATLATRLCSLQDALSLSDILSCFCKVSPSLSTFFVCCFNHSSHPFSFLSFIRLLASSFFLSPWSFRLCFLMSSGSRPAIIEELSRNGILPLVFDLKIAQIPRCTCPSSSPLPHLPLSSSFVSSRSVSKHNTNMRGKG